MQISPSEERARLDADLSRRGWARDGETDVLVAVTAASVRRRGIAGHVVHALARWAAARGAERAYAQVAADNAGAQAFWASAGFERSHGYHYRVGPAA